MKKTFLKGLAAATVVGAGLAMPSGTAAADSFRISVHTPHVGVSYGHHDSHRSHHKGHGTHYSHSKRYGHGKHYTHPRSYGHGKHYAHPRSYGHGKHYAHPRSYGHGKHYAHPKRYGHGYGKHYKRYTPRHTARGHHASPKHVCRYESRPVTKYYYNEYGDRVGYTAYESVRVCESYHHR